MSAAILLIPFLLARFVLLQIISKDGLQRAAHYAQPEEKETGMTALYQLSTLILLVYPFFLPVKLSSDLPFYTGCILYTLGLLLCVWSVYDFARPDAQGMCRQGIYRFSRNPMYVAYGLVFLGMASLCQSWIFFVFVLLFQVTGHYLILAEERWCLTKFGRAYQGYMLQVRRYL